MNRSYISTRNFIHEFLEFLDVLCEDTDAPRLKRGRGRFGLEQSEIIRREGSKGVDGGDGLRK